MKLDQFKIDVNIGDIVRITLTGPSHYTFINRIIDIEIWKIGNLDVATCFKTDYLNYIPLDVIEKIEILDIDEIQYRLSL
jgi:hypothetical protein